MGLIKHTSINGLITNSYCYIFPGTKKINHNKFIFESRDNNPLQKVVGRSIIFRNKKKQWSWVLQLKLRRYHGSSNMPIDFDIKLEDVMAYLKKEYQKHLLFNLDMIIPHKTYVLSDVVPALESVSLKSLNDKQKRGFEKHLEMVKEYVYIA